MAQLENGKDLIMKTVYDENWAIGSPFVTISNHHNEEGEVSYTNGSYNFNGGSVLMYREPKLLSLSFYFKGRGYYRTIRGKDYTDIGCGRKAGEFAREILNRHSRP